MESGPREEPLHDVAPLLPAYLNATLSDEERSQVEQHLTTCAACRQELEEFRQLRQAMAMARATQPGPSPDLFSRVKERLAQTTPASASVRDMTTRQPWWEPVSAWVASLFARRWGPALATGLIAVQFVIIAGFVGNALLTSKEPVPGHEVPSSGTAFLQAAQFQAALRSSEDLGTLVATHSPLPQQHLTLGFIGSTRGTRSFLIGTLYAELLAYVRSERRDVVVQHVATMDKALQTLQMPSASPLPPYMGTVHALLDSGTYSTEVAGRFLALFQPLYEAYAATQEPPLLPLFRAGAWLVDMTLSAAASDTALLRQESSVQYFRQEFQRIGAPQGVQQAIEELGRLIAQPKLADRDIKKILTQIRKLQDLLG